MIDIAASAIGGMVGMAGALGYGFKMLVDVVGKQLAAQNVSISNLETNISLQLKEHITDCRSCQVVDSAALVSQSAAAVSAVAAQTSEIVAAIHGLKGVQKNE